MHIFAFNHKYFTHDRFLHKHKHSSCVAVSTSQKQIAMIAMIVLMAKIAKIAMIAKIATIALIAMIAPIL